VSVSLAFTKGAGKTDRLVITHPGGAQERIDCPKQGIIPHDMVHYAVESILAARGFLGRVVAGEKAAFTMTAEAESDGIERLVEVIQADAWSGGNASAGEMIDLYMVTCAARHCPPLAIGHDSIDAIRAEIRRLTEAWSATPTGGMLALRFG
jgi:hypothetical protein